MCGRGWRRIGAFQRATLAYVDPESLEYLALPVAEQVEVLSFLGDVAVEDRDPAIHVHVVVGRRDGTTRGGHLQEGIVWPTHGVVVNETPAHRRKRTDPETGLALIDLASSEPGASS